MYIKEYPSLIGKHCATNSLAEISRYYGNNITEAMVLGLSKGLSFNYVPYTDYIPRLVNLRNPVIEKSFFDILEFPFKWNYSDELNFEKINNYLSQGVPILILVDISKLGFFQTSEDSLGSIGAHTLSIVGYDKNRDIYHISEYFQKQYIEVSKVMLQKASKVPKPPFFVKNMWAPIHKFKIINLEQKIIQSIKQNAENFLFGSEFYGLKSILNLSQEISYWPELPFWKENSYNTYMGIERIGTGGAGFRKLYLEFLNEVELLIPEFKQAALTELLPDIISIYKKISLNFYYVHRYGNAKYFKEIKELLVKLYGVELEFWKKAYLLTDNISNKT